MDHAFPQRPIDWVATCSKLINGSCVSATTHWLSCYLFKLRTIYGHIWYTWKFRTLYVAVYVHTHGHIHGHLHGHIYGHDVILVTISRSASLGHPRLWAYATRYPHFEPSRLPASQTARQPPSQSVSQPTGLTASRTPTPATRLRQSQCTPTRTRFLLWTCASYWNQKMLRGLSGSYHGSSSGSYHGRSSGSYPRECKWIISAGAQVTSTAQTQNKYLQ